MGEHDRQRSVTNADLLTTGLSRRKVATLRAVAAQYADGSLSDEALRGMSDQEIIDRLTTISGIGPWTVHGMLIIALDRADVVLPGDLALRKAIQRAYQLGHLPSQQEVLQIAEPWRPYRSLATAYLFQVAVEDPGAPPPGQASVIPGLEAGARRSLFAGSLNRSTGRGGVPARAAGRWRPRWR